MRCMHALVVPAVRHRRKGGGTSSRIRPLPGASWLSYRLWLTDSGGPGDRRRTRTSHTPMQLCRLQTCPASSSCGQTRLKSSAAISMGNQRRSRPTAARRRRCSCPTARHTRVWRCTASISQRCQPMWASPGPWDRPRSRRGRNPRSCARPCCSRTLVGSATTDVVSFSAPPPPPSRTSTGRFRPRTMNNRSLNLAVSHMHV